MDADIGDDRVHPDAVGVPCRFPDGIRRVNGIEELAVLEHLRPDALVDAAPQMFDELAVDVLGHRREQFRRFDRHLGFQSARREELEFDVIEPGGSRGLPPTAEKAVEREGVVGPAVEVELQPRPILSSADRLGLDIGAVEAKQSSPARPRIEVLSLDPAPQAVPGKRPGRDDGRPGSITAIS